MIWIGWGRYGKGHTMNLKEGLAITETQSYGEIDTNGIELNGQTTLTERFEERHVNASYEVVNKSITDGCIHNKVEEYRRLG
jgi:hypothetical protein